MVKGKDGEGGNKVSQQRLRERRYLLKEFTELVSCHDDSNILEVGCGNGSTVLPILRCSNRSNNLIPQKGRIHAMKAIEPDLPRISGNANIIVYACDCSTEALERAKEIIDTADGVPLKQRFHPFHCDISTSGLPNWLRCDSCQENPALSKKDHSESNSRCVKDLASLERSTCCIGGMDFLTLIFTLSAVPFQMMPLVLTECFFVLKPGGLLLFRDYGLYDMTMLRFEPNKRVGFREYMRSDGTRSYFFSLDTVRGLFVDAGFVELELEYCCVKSVNRRNGKCLKRVWVHGKFQKPELLS
ncbi:hypothetical protein RJ641_023443 [Dillenia turbinata]|uniref:tRNA N(3)-methylcytidine methyltransferase n=1 Tax=Dillenia turbinata TaxID=194707 RepID=A0AAN8U9J1_9MAGN